MIQPLIERVIAWSTTPARQEELLAVKAGFFERTGEAHEEDRSYERRIALFLEHWAFDHALAGEGRTPVQAFPAAHPGLEPAERGDFEDLARFVHGIFEVRKVLGGRGLRLREVLSGEDHEVFLPEGLPGIEKGDLLEARLVPHRGELVFTQGLLYHPRDARKVVLKEARRRTKVNPEARPQDLAHDLARMALKLERYRSAQVAQIYRFD